MPSVSSKDTILVRWPLYSSAIMSNFRQMRINNKLIDAILSVENKQIPVHRIVLASCSKYFDRTFESSISSIGNPTIYVLFGKQYEEVMQYEVVMQVIELFYSGHIDVPKKNWNKFLATTKLLEVNGFENVGDVNPISIEKEFQMQNCYVSLVKVSEPASTPPNDAAGMENTPSFSMPDLEDPPTIATAGMAANPPTRARKNPSNIIASGTSKTASTAMTGARITPATAVSKPNVSKSTLSNTRLVTPTARTPRTAKPMRSAAIEAPSNTRLVTPTARTPRTARPMKSAAIKTVPSNLRKRSPDDQAISPERIRPRELLLSDSSDFDDEDIDSQDSAVETRAIPSLNSLVCQYCNHHYTRRDHLKDHLMTEHVGDIKI